MKTATLQLETLTCPSCTQKIEGALKSLDGVDQDSIKVLFNASKAKVSYDEEKLSLKEIERAIRQVGYTIEKSKER
ncbi:MAG: heavy-metal-associated domain-containing protein [Gallicola sp.]|uniref:heavy-metal-associated domain-containing protein n=1 Tax=Gallicola sp. Sow4_E12 TaxID=3438785 RepID=UPI0017CB2C9B|nr:heavy-metal-associated domain-containing protein [Gallicola sp.]